MPGGPTLRYGSSSGNDPKAVPLRGISPCPPIAPGLASDSSRVRQPFGALRQALEVILGARKLSVNGVREALFAVALEV
jgi:hypothetical protein